MGTFKFRKCLYIVRCSCPIQTIEIIVIWPPWCTYIAIISLLFYPWWCFSNQFCHYLAPEGTLSFSFLKSSNVRVKTTFQNRGISDKIIRCFLASVPYKAFAHVCRWALNLLLLTNICDKLYENYSNPAKKSNSVCLQN